MIGADDQLEALLADGDQNKDSKIDFDGNFALTALRTDLRNTSNSIDSSRFIVRV